MEEALVTFNTRLTEIVISLGSVVDFSLDVNDNYVIVIEKCDYYHEEIIDKKNLKILIEKLQELESKLT
jgi:hypothetical protein